MNPTVAVLRLQVLALAGVLIMVIESGSLWVLLIWLIGLYYSLRFTRQVWR